MAPLTEEYTTKWASDIGTDVDPGTGAGGAVTPTPVGQTMTGTTVVVRASAVAAETTTAPPRMAAIAKWLAHTIVLVSTLGDVTSGTHRASRDPKVRQAPGQSHRLVTLVPWTTPGPGQLSGDAATASCTTPMVNPTTVPSRLLARAGVRTTRAAGTSSTPVSAIEPSCSIVSVAVVRTDGKPEPEPSKGRSRLRVAEASSTVPSVASRN